MLKTKFDPPTDKCFPAPSGIRLSRPAFRAVKSKEALRRYRVRQDASRNPNLARLHDSARSTLRQPEGTGRQEPWSVGCRPLQLYLQHPAEATSAQPETVAAMLLLHRGAATEAFGAEILLCIGNLHCQQPRTQYARIGS